MGVTVFQPWGKSPERLSDGDDPYPLTAHLIDTAAMAGALWDLWLSHRLRAWITEVITPGDPDRARRWVQLAAALHDVGKANPVFQMQSADGRELDWRASMIDRFTAAGVPQVDANVEASLVGDRTCIARRHEYHSFTALTGRAITREDPPRLSSDWLAIVAAGHR